jgi:hypothetical protein
MMKKIFFSIYSFLFVVKYSNFGIKIPHKGRSCDTIHILANGPSLLSSITEYWDEISCSHVMAVNHFVQSEYYEKLKPEYYVFADPMFWLLNEKDHRTKEVLLTLKQLKEKTKWTLSLFVPYAGKKTIEKEFMYHDNIRLYFYNTTEFIGGFNWLRKFLYNHNLAAPTMGNVLVAAIFLSLKTGFESIYLYGADHSWTKDLRINDQNEVCIAEKHFYRESKLKPWQFGEKMTMYSILRMLSLMFKGYEEINTYLLLNKSNQQIHNRTRESFIDVFKRD